MGESNTPSMRWLRDEKSRINALASYNSERARGIVHTDEWRDFMATEQEWFDQRQRSEMLVRGGVEVAPGVWHVPTPKRRRWVFR